MSMRKHESNVEKRILELEEKILHSEERILCILRNIEYKLAPHTARIAIQFTGESTMNTLVLNVGQSSIASIVALEADGVTVTPGAVVSAQVFTVSDPSITVTDNSDGTATILGVTPSSGAVSGSASATVTDADGAVVNLTQPFTVTVNGPVTPPTGLTTQIGIAFTPAA
jgi:hypothetical protein